LFSPPPASLTRHVRLRASETKTSRLGLRDFKDLLDAKHDTTCV